MLDRYQTVILMPLARVNGRLAVLDFSKRNDPTAGHDTPEHTGLQGDPKRVPN